MSPVVVRLEHERNPMIKRMIQLCIKLEKYEMSRVFFGCPAKLFSTILFNANVIFLHLPRMIVALATENDLIVRLRPGCCCSMALVPFTFKTMLISDVWRHFFFTL